jgi:hypothetical protein
MCILSGQVGVRVNTFKNHRNQQAVMQFCCGFGPRKAAQFLEQFDAGTCVRRSLLLTCAVRCCRGSCCQSDQTSQAYSRV